MLTPLAIPLKHNNNNAVYSQSWRLVTASAWQWPVLPGIPEMYGVKSQGQHRRNHRVQAETAFKGQGKLHQRPRELGICFLSPNQCPLKFPPHNSYTQQLYQHKVVPHNCYNTVFTESVLYPLFPTKSIEAFCLIIGSTTVYKPSWVMWWAHRKESSGDQS